MVCPVCGSRKARRGCPALNKTICAVCCGTKRLVEIACPEHCSWLASAREHPAAVVRRQQERDVAVIVPALQGLTERQHQIFFLFQTAIARHVPDGFTRLSDADVAEAAGVVASGLETAARGVIYEPAAQSLPAQRLAGELKALLADMRQQGATVYDREAAIVLRTIEQGARETGRMTGASETAYLEVMARLLQQNRASHERSRRAEADAHAAEKPGPSLIIPG